MIDTNVYISSILKPASLVAEAVDWVMANGRVLLSIQAEAELLDVVVRSKLDRFQPIERRIAASRQIIRKSHFVPVSTLVTACRDTKDNHILALAVDGNADYVITGDADLLVLNPFQGIPILAPADFLTVVA